MNINLVDVNHASEDSNTKYITEIFAAFSRCPDSMQLKDVFCSLNQKHILVQIAQDLRIQSS